MSEMPRDECRHHLQVQRVCGCAICLDCGATWSGIHDAASGYDCFHWTGQTLEELALERLLILVAARDEHGQWGNPRRRREKAAGRAARRFKTASRLIATGGICPLCQVETDAFETDHIVPISMGGSDDDDNLRLICGRCNSRKGARTDAEWLVALERRQADPFANLSQEELRILESLRFVTGTQPTEESD